MSSLAFLLAAAEGAEEHSKTAFYFAGGALAAWAVIVSAIGMRWATFPHRTAVGRLAMLVTVVLVAGAMSMAVVTS
jgi:hypothetical protein